jgi:hypothetical protein
VIAERRKVSCPVIGFVCRAVYNKIIIIIIIINFTHLLLENGILVNIIGNKYRRNGIGSFKFSVRSTTLTSNPVTGYNNI